MVDSLGDKRKRPFKPRGPRPVRGQRCDAICPGGRRCGNIIAQKYLDNHYVKQPYGHRLGLLCSVHWSVCHRGGKVRLRAGCHVLLRDGAYVFTPVRGASEAMLAAAGLTTVHQPNVAKVVEES